MFVFFQPALVYDNAFDDIVGPMPEEIIIEKEPEIIPSQAVAVQPNRHYFYQGKNFYKNNN